GREQRFRIGWPFMTLPNQARRQGGTRGARRSFRLADARLAGDRIDVRWMLRRRLAGDAPRRGIDLEPLPALILDQQLAAVGAQRAEPHILHIAFQLGAAWIFVYLEPPHFAMGRVISRQHAADLSTRFTVAANLGITHGPDGDGWHVRRAPTAGAQFGYGGHVVLFAWRRRRGYGQNYKRSRCGVAPFRSAEAPGLSAHPGTRARRHAAAFGAGCVSAEERSVDMRNRAAAGTDQDLPDHAARQSPALAGAAAGMPARGCGKAGA